MRIYLIFLAELITAARTCFQRSGMETKYKVSRAPCPPPAMIQPTSTWSFRIAGYFAHSAELSRDCQGGDIIGRAEERVTVNRNRGPLERSKPLRPSCGCLLRATNAAEGNADKDLVWAVSTLLDRRPRRFRSRERELLRRTPQSSLTKGIEQALTNSAKYCTFAPAVHLGCSHSRRVFVLKEELMRTSPTAGSKSQNPVPYAAQIANPPVGEGHVDDHILKDIQLFSALSVDCRQVEKRMRRREYPPNTVIVREGTPGTSMLFIEAGAVGDRQEGPAYWDQLPACRTRPQGESFGEMSLLTRSPRHGHRPNASTDDMRRTGAS